MANQDTSPPENLPTSDTDGEQKNDIQSRSGQKDQKNTQKKQEETEIHRDYSEKDAGKKNQSKKQQKSPPPGKQQQDDKASGESPDRESGKSEDKKSSKSEGVTPPKSAAGPPKASAGVSNKAIWIGLFLFVVGIIAGGAVGWNLFISQGDGGNGPVVQDPQNDQDDQNQDTNGDAPGGQDQEPGGQDQEPDKQLTPAQQRDQERVSEMADLRIALELYKDRNGSYPVSDGISRSIDQDYALSVLVEEGHIDSIPSDPLRVDQNYYYGYESENGENYRLSAVAESSETPCRQIREDLCIIEYGPSGLLNQDTSNKTQDTKSESGTSTPTINDESGSANPPEAN